MLRNAFSLARLLVSQDWDGIGKVDVVLGLRRDGGYDWDDIDARLAAASGAITVRRAEWKVWPTDALHRWFLAAPPVPDVVAEVLLPCDRAHNFLDCDGWIVFGGSMQGYVAAARPCAVYCPDLIQRYVPEIFDSLEGNEQAWLWKQQITTLLAWRSSRCVFATTPKTLADAVEYAGVPADRAILVPTLVDALTEDSAAPSGQAHAPYILWVTNSSPHKNHPAAIAAMQIYYDELGGTLPVVVIGAHSDWLDPRSGVDCPGSRAFRRTPAALRHTQFAGEVSDAAYLGLIGRAAVVWHNVIVDNGSFVAFDAARAGRHFVSSDYPQMRYLCERYGVAPIWHPPGDAAAAARALALGERRFAAGEPPPHAPRYDSESERISGYGVLLQRLFDEVAR